MEVEDEIPQVDCANGSSSTQTEQYLEKSDCIQVEVTELEYCLLGSEDADICIIKSFLKGREMNVVKNFVLLDTGGRGPGAEVADAVPFFNGADHLWTAQGRRAPSTGKERRQVSRSNSGI